jgi:hypothetical protein
MEFTPESLKELQEKPTSWLLGLYCKGELTTLEAALVREELGRRSLSDEMLRQLNNSGKRFYEMGPKLSGSEKIKKSADSNTNLSSKDNWLKREINFYVNRWKKDRMIYLIGLPSLWIMATLIASLIFCGPASQHFMEEGAYTAFEKSLWETVPVDSLLVTVRTVPRELFGTSMQGIPFSKVIYYSAIFSLVFNVGGFLLGADDRSE